MSSVAKPPRARLPPPPRSLTVRASKTRKKGSLCVDPAGYAAGKKMKRKKRHVLVDTRGLMMDAIVDAADRDGGALVIATVLGASPFLMKLYADDGYQGAELQRCRKAPRRA
jgi:hypothetical protein